MVSHAARVGAMTMTRPDAGSAAPNAACCGPQRSWIARITPPDRCKEGASCGGPQANYRSTGGFLTTTGGGGVLPANPFAPDGVSVFVFSLVTLSAKTTRPFGGTFFTAAAQSVGAGCCWGGT